MRASLLCLALLFAPALAKQPRFPHVNNSIEARRLLPSGFQAYTIHHGGYDRTFIVYVPEAVTADAPAAGLVYFFHGFTLNLDLQCGGNPGEYTFQARKNADEHNFIAVCLQGLGDDEAGWNVELCCGAPPDLGVDDVSFARAVVDKMELVLRNDFNGVAVPDSNNFAFGFSNGAEFSFRLSCELNDKLNGFTAVGAGAFWAFGEKGTMTWPDKCKTSGGMSVWNGIGTQDEFTTWELAYGLWTNYAQKILHCSGAVEEDHVNKLVTCSTFSNCADGKHARLCIYTGLIHEVYRMGVAPWSLETTTAAWNFLTAAPAASRRTAANATILV